VSLPVLSDAEIKAITKRLKAGQPLDDQYRDRLFQQSKDAEVVYSGKESRGSVLARTMGVPFQSVKRFGDHDPAWANKLVFGENLQVLKTLLEMKQRGELRNADGTNGVRVCYIDPPFATRREFRGSRGQTAYRDRVEGAEFIEFLRKRLILIHELLADDGTLYLHLDPKKGHYMKVVLDEIFGPDRFRNEIIWWYYNKMQGNVGRFPANHDCIYVYGKTADSYFEPVFEERAEITSMIQRVWDGEKKRLVNAKGPDGKVLYIEREDKRIDDVWRLSMLQPADRTEKVDYPTQKPLSLLQLAIAASSKPGDLVLDAFAGSGTAAIAAERLGRRWIAVDCGKLAIYTTQQRLLSMTEGKGRKKKAVPPAPFDVVHAGLYDNNRLNDLSFAEFEKFALELFGCAASPSSIKDIAISGTRGGDPVHIFPFDETEAEMGIEYVQTLHERIAAQVNSVVYVIAPDSRCDPYLFENMITLDRLTYFVLRVPYSVIEALHDEEFRPIGQPFSVEEVNDALDAYGFDFMDLPEAKLTARRLKDSVRISIKEFRRGGLDPDVFAELENQGRDDLSVAMVDLAYGDNGFQLDQHRFGEDLRANDWKWDIPVDDCGDKLRLVLIDTFGNELRQTIELTKGKK